MLAYPDFHVLVRDMIDDFAAIAPENRQLCLSQLRSNPQRHVSRTMNVRD